MTLNAYSVARRNYVDGFWTKAMLDQLVDKGRLTPEEAEEIVSLRPDGVE